MLTLEEKRIYKRNWNRRKKGVTPESLAVSATCKGRRGELLAMNILTGSTDMNAVIRMNYDFDLLWQGNRVDVKTCNLYKRKIKRGKPVTHSAGWWVFNKNKNDADLYFCICMIDNIPTRYYLIPSERFAHGITVGQKSDKFIHYQLPV